MSVTLLEVMAAARSRAASLVAEVAGYLVLGVADQVVGAPRSVAAAEVLLTEEGALRVLGGSAASEVDAESELRGLLGRLLGVSASITPPLLRSSQREPLGTVAALVRELEAALIPVNRAAARRAMARLYRDVERARDSGRLAAIELPAQPIASVPAPPVVQALPPPPPAPRVEEEPAVVEVVLAAAMPPVTHEESSPFVLVETSVESESPPMIECSREPVTAPEPVVSRRLMEPSQLSPMIPSPTVVWDVPDLEVPSESPMAVEIDAYPETDPPLELEGSDATERVPDITPELTLPLVVARAPLPAFELPELVLDPPPMDDAAWDDGSEHTPGLRDLVTVARAFVPSRRVASDPDDIVIEPERTEPLPPAAPAEPAPPPAWTRDEYEEFVGIDAQPSAHPLAFEPPDPGPEPEPEPEPLLASPIAPMPVVAVVPLVPAPTRPRPFVPAPSRFQPRRSDVDALVADFGVSESPEPRALCEDLKRLAGVERTHAPPQVSTRTPPPVEVDSEAGDAPRTLARGSRIGLGALAFALVASGAGAVSSAVSSAPNALVAAAAVPDLEPIAEPSCSATLAVSGIPNGGRALVREGGEASSRSPSRVEAGAAIFDGLRCREPVEVTVASEADGHKSWLRIPVSAEAMSPSESAPSQVRVAVTAR